MHIGKETKKLKIIKKLIGTDSVMDIGTERIGEQSSNSGLLCCIHCHTNTLGKDEHLLPQDKG